MCLPFTQVMGENRLLAVADEEGLVFILDTRRPLPTSLYAATPRAQWLAHDNAIFDLKWCQVRPLQL